jgi:3'-5' exonuclease
MNLFIDIETLPTDRHDVRELIASKVTHPGNISKAETIAKWYEESKPAAVDDAVAKTSLDGTFGRVCVIGWAVDDGPVRTVKSESDEEGLLLQFAELLRQDMKAADLFDTAVIGHNVSAFDLRFLVQRFMVCGIKPPSVIARAAQAKPWESDKVFDTMVQWAGVGNRVSLEKLCMALSIASPKTDLDGSKVAAAVAAGRIEDVADYCAGDVDAMRKVWRRMTFQESPPSAHVLKAAQVTEVA